jgi:hypothetical protein
MVKLKRKITLIKEHEKSKEWAKNKKKINIP